MCVESVRQFVHSCCVCRAHISELCVCVYVCFPYLLLLLVARGTRERDTTYFTSTLYMYSTYQVVFVAFLLAFHAGLFTQQMPLIYSTNAYTWTYLSIFYEVRPY